MAYKYDSPKIKKIVENDKNLKHKRTNNVNFENELFKNIKVTSKIQNIIVNIKN
jgi:hypothetical protein